VSVSVSEAKTAEQPPTPDAPRSAFRTDIAGIRGIAVMLVVLCHFEIPGFGGGFIGPDLFFVLSGYLISGLLVKEYARNAYDRSVRAKTSKKRKSRKRRTRGKISVGQFYLRRARRILPASIFVLLCVNIYARFNSNALQVAQIKTDSWWALLFSANINFLRQATDYFAQNNAVSPVQHYWSLSVEEQFYFVWPLLFLTAINFHNFRYQGKKLNWQQRLFGAFATIGVISFVWMLIEFTRTPTTAYFSTFSRAWELALGGALSLIPVDAVARKLGKVWLVLRVIALAAMLGSIALVTPTNFGYTLVIPAAATGFLLLSGSVAKDDLVYRILSLKPLVALGAISFSLYLWHWPVFVFGRDLNGMATLSERFAGVTVSILLATLSYWLVERTFLGFPLPEFKRIAKGVASIGLAKSRAFTTSMTAIVVLILGVITYPHAFAIVPGAEVWQPPASAASHAPNVKPSNNGSDANVPNNGDAQSLASKVSESDILEGIKLRSLPAAITPSVENVRKATAGGFYCDGTWISQDRKNCTRPSSGSGKTRSAYVIGDSHAAMLWNTVTGALPSDTWNVALLAKASCPNGVYHPGVKAKDDQGCEAFRDEVMKVVARAQPDLIILSDAFDFGNEKVLPEDVLASDLRVYRKFQKYTKNIIQFQGSPFTPVIAQCLTANGGLSKCTPTNDNSSGRSRIARKAATKKANVLLVSLAKWMCLDGKCPLVIKNTIVTSDGNHLTPPFASLLAPSIATALQEHFPKLFLK